MTQKHNNSHPIRDAYREKLETELNRFEAEFELLQAKASVAEAKVKVKREALLKSLKKRRKALRDKLHELGTAGHGASDALKEGVEDAWTDLKDALADAKKKF